MPLRFTGTVDNPKLLDLPWSTPLDEWPPESLVALPRGISRHVVRFVRVDHVVYALKEIHADLAIGEYRLLRTLERMEIPAVHGVGVALGRENENGEELDAILATHHLQFSLPYRALFSHTLRPDTADRLLDALVVLLVQLHLAGFFWGDCSLSNTLFRRDAGAFAAYLVDAETGELHVELSKGQRDYDLEIARVNIIGELMDLAGGGLLHESVDPITTGEDVVRRYAGLWSELTDTKVIDIDERYEIEARIRRLNDLGFDVAELDITTDWHGRQVRLQPKVVDAGHHSRRLLRLTGLDVEENQARRLLNDLDAYTAATDQQGEDEEIVAHEWLTRCFEAVVRRVPPRLRGKLEPAEIYHEVLEHRWFMAEALRRDVPLQEAARDYIETVLTHKPDEKAVLGARPTLDRLDDLETTAEIRIVFPEDV